MSTRRIDIKFDCVGKLAEKSEANEQTGQWPPPGKARCAFERQPERVKRCHPEKDRKRIDRQNETAEIEDRRDIERDHGPKAGERTKQPLRKVIEKQTRPGGEQRTPKANPKLVVAKNHGARPDGESDARTLAEIGERGPLRPHPIIGFVGRQLRRAEQRQPNARSGREERSKRRGSCTHEIASPTRRGCLTKKSCAQRAMIQR